MRTKTFHLRAAELARPLAVDHHEKRSGKRVLVLNAGSSSLTFAVFGSDGPPGAPIARICEGLGILGLQLAESRNAQHAAIISTNASRVSARIICTNEELMIARAVSRLLKPDARAKTLEP